MDQKAILVVGHGSRSKDAVAEFEKTIGLMAQKLENTKVAGAHMELAEPTIEATVEELFKQGYTNLTVVPYFLFNGNHIKEDIPTILTALRDKFQGLTIQMTSPIGADPLLAEILIKRVSGDSKTI